MADYFAAFARNVGPSIAVVITRQKMRTDAARQSHCRICCEALAKLSAITHVSFLERYLGVWHLLSFCSAQVSCTRVNNRGKRCHSENMAQTTNLFCLYYDAPGDLDAISSHDHPFYEPHTARGTSLL